MDDVRTLPRETEAERVARLHQEALLIAEAEREIADGNGISGDEVKRFFAWFVSDDEGPPPAASDEG